MSILKLLVVEGNTKEENSNFNKAGCVPQSENFKQHIKILEPNCEVDIVEPGDDNSINEIIDKIHQLKTESLDLTKKSDAARP